MKSSLLRFLPWAAALLAATFIVWDASLMSSTAQVQARVKQQMAQVEGLQRLGPAIDVLAATHRTDLQGGHQWPLQLAAARNTFAAETAALKDIPALGGLAESLKKDLAACDSLHREAKARPVGSEAAAMADAVFGLMVQRMRGHVEGAVGTVQKAGLEQGAAALGRQWSRAQWMLGMASLFALVCAVLAAYVARLLDREHERGELLARTGQELEQRNRELRETMLSKEEKEVMLKEIHHRVKNNLQIVRSLIRFQTDKVSDPAVLELFNECVNRVGAMALVHEQTYMSKDLANIDVASYLNSLVRDLVAAYNIRLKLNMDVDVQVKTLGVDTLTPLGLLINEVVSNSFKHAFAGREEGKLILHLSGTEEGGLLLRVGDDGVGMPDLAKWEKPNSLGMDLIRTLAGQLNGDMQLHRGPGMVYEMTTAPEKELRRRA